MGRASALIVVSTAISISSLLINFNALVAIAHANDVDPAEVVGSSLMGSLGLLLLAYLSYKGRNWARIVLVVMFIGELFLSVYWQVTGVVPSYGEAFEQDPIQTLGALLSSVFFLAAAVMYFLPNSNDWYREIKAAGHYDDGFLSFLSQPITARSFGGLMLIGLGVLLILAALGSIRDGAFVVGPIVIVAGLVLIWIGIGLRDTSAPRNSDNSVAD